MTTLEDFLRLMAGQLPGPAMRPRPTMQIRSTITDRAELEALETEGLLEEDEKQLLDHLRTQDHLTGRLVKRRAVIERIRTGRLPNEPVVFSNDDRV